jgi:purine nucleosidase
VYRGAESPLVCGKDEYEAFHGQDGFGDHYDPIPPKLESEHGALAIIRYAHQYKNGLSILALGPLTNLALAVRMDPSIKDCVKDIYLMGGNSEGMQ